VGGRVGGGGGRAEEVFREGRMVGAKENYLQRNVREDEWGGGGEMETMIQKRERERERERRENSKSEKEREGGRLKDRGRDAYAH